jgi:hypothetical protein
MNDQCLYFSNIKPQYTLCHSLVRLKGLYQALYPVLCLLSFLGSSIGIPSKLYAQNQPQAQVQKSKQATIKALFSDYQALKPSCLDPSFQKIKIKVHMALITDKKSQKTIQNAQWLFAQISEANRLFARLSICFELLELVKLDDQYNELKTSHQRTSLGKSRIKIGQIDIFVVSRLADIDIKGEEIRGVHWRNPENRKGSRWIILSKIAGALVLAHELGHYFDLPHSEYEASIMNKKERSYPMSQRGFVDSEYEIMEKAKTRMLTDKHLIPIH